MEGERERGTHMHPFNYKYTGDCKDSRNVECVVQMVVSRRGVGCKPATPPHSYIKEKEEKEIKMNNNNSRIFK